MKQVDGGPGTLESARRRVSPQVSPTSAAISRVIMASPKLPGPDGRDFPIEQLKNWVKQCVPLMQVKHLGRFASAGKLIHSVGIAFGHPTASTHSCLLFFIRFAPVRR